MLSPSIPPEKLLRALLLQALYTIRSERLLMEQLDYNLLFRWFVGLSMDDKVWNHSVFSKNRERFLGSDLAAAEPPPLDFLQRGQAENWAPQPKDLDYCRSLFPVPWGGALPPRRWFIPRLPANDSA